MNLLEVIQQARSLPISSVSVMRIRRKDWSKDYYIEFHEEHVSFILTAESILATDWEVVKEFELCSFPDALIALKEGKKVKRMLWILQYDQFEHYVELKNDIFVYGYKDITTKKGFKLYKDYSATNNDLLANDWIIFDGK